MKNNKINFKNVKYFIILYNLRFNLFYICISNCSSYFALVIYHNSPRALSLQNDGQVYDQWQRH